MRTNTKQVYLVGTFNAWTPNHPEFGLEPVHDRLWEGPVYLHSGRHAFKFTADGRWERNWGGHAVAPVRPPHSGTLVADGADILLNVPVPGRYGVQVDFRRHTFRIQPLEIGSGPSAALHPRKNTRLLGDLLMQRDRHLPLADLNGHLPLLSEDEVVFVLEGSGDASVTVAGTWNNWSTTRDVMVQGPGLRFLCLPLPRDRSHLYKFHCQGTWFRDPHNRLVAWDGYNRQDVGEFNSVVPSLHGHRDARPLVWLKHFPSAFLNDQRDIFVQLPPDYNPYHRYPVLYVNDGNEFITRAEFHHRADEAMKVGRCEPMLLVYVALPTQMVRNFQYVGSPGWPDYANFLADELVPFIDSHFNTRSNRESRAVIGASLGGASAYYVAFSRPEIFGKAAAQSGSFFVNGMELIRWVREGDPKPLTLYLDSSRPGPNGGGDMSRLGDMMALALRKRRYKFLHYQTEGDRHDWWYWGNRLPMAMKFLFPR